MRLSEDCALNDFELIALSLSSRWHVNTSACKPNWSPHHCTTKFCTSFSGYSAVTRNIELYDVNFLFRGAVLTNQLIAKEMKEQNLQQSRKFDEIKQRTATIRKRYEEQQHYGAAGAFTPQTYGQGTSSNRSFYVFILLRVSFPW